MPNVVSGEQERMMRLGARLKAARLAQGLTQDELVERLGYKDRSYISEYENGKRRLYAHDLVGYAHALGVPVVTLLEDAPESAGEAGSLEGAMAELLHGVPPNRQHLAMELLAQILDVLGKERAPTVGEMQAAYEQLDDADRAEAHAIMDQVLKEGNSGGATRSDAAE